MIFAPDQLDVASCFEGTEAETLARRRRAVALESILAVIVENWSIVR